MKMGGAWLGLLREQGLLASTPRHFSYEWINMVFKKTCYCYSLSSGISTYLPLPHCLACETGLKHWSGWPGVSEPSCVGLCGYTGLGAGSEKHKCEFDCQQNAL